MNITSSKVMFGEYFIKVTLVYASLFLLTIPLVNAQFKSDSIAEAQPRIAVMARVQTEGRILLRWGVTNQKAWRKSNKYGFELKRYTITRNEVTLSIPEELNLGVFKPKPLEEWMEVIDNNDNAAIMAQALYGESFDVSGMDDLSAIINLSQEQEQRFTWALYSADQDFTTAELAGLGFADYNIKENEKYVYKVTSLVPSKELKIEDGGVFIGMSDYEDLPAPLDLAAIFLDQKVMLSWNYAIHKDVYNNYIVERSSDGENFHRLHEKPLGTLNNSEKHTPDRMFYVDSITNNQSYDYRIRGISPFGEISQPSKIVSGEGKRVLAYVPRISYKDFLDENRIIIEWEFLNEGNQFISGFELNKSQHVDGPYKTVIKNISPESRKVQYDSLSPTNYFTITAIGKQGSNRTSLPALVQPVDSIPPAPPTELSGTVDTTGLVTLKWNRNIEKDMLGYRVFRGNNENEEFSQITIAPHQGIVYYDSVSVQNLNSKIYYQVVAVDQRFNQSDFSEVLELKKPDLIRPNPPIFKSYEIKNGTIYIEWIRSSSEDVVIHELYRKVSNEEEWLLINSITHDMDSVFQDSDLTEGLQYYYTLIARDESGLESDPTNPLAITIPKTSLMPPIEKFSGEVNKRDQSIELHWKPYLQKNVAELMIYKSTDAQKSTLLRNLLPDAVRLIDKEIKPNNLYTYIIRAMYLDGRVSESKIIEIKY